MRSNDPIYIYDARLLERHIKNGLIAECDVRTFVQSLPERAENAEALSIKAEAPGPAAPLSRTAP